MPPEHVNGLTGEPAKSDPDSKGLRFNEGKPLVCPH